MFNSNLKGRARWFVRSTENSGRVPVKGRCAGWRARYRLPKTRGDDNGYSSQQRQPIHTAWYHVG